MTRRLHVQGDVGSPIYVTTGVPEGDSMSVCAMLVISSAFYWYIQTPSVFPMWTIGPTSLPINNTISRHCLASNILHHFAHLRIQIDYAKSWAWGSTQDAWKEWKTLLNELFRIITLSISIILPKIYSRLHVPLYTPNCARIISRKKWPGQLSDVAAFDISIQTFTKKQNCFKRLFGHMIFSGPKRRW